MNRILPHIAIIGFAALALYLTLSVPFYYSWDMDLSTILDLLLLQNNEMPAHMNHPAFGMYWVLFWAQELAQKTGLITQVSIANLADSLEPFLILAEQMQFIRIVNALACISLAVVLWKAISQIFRLSKTQDILLLLVFLTLPGIWRYDLLLVRSETYSLLFWAVSLLYTIKSAQSEKKKYKILAGFFAAISFFSKIQAFFLIIILVPIYAILKNNQIVPQAIANIKSKIKIYALVFFLICVAAYLTPKPPYLADFAAAYGTSKFFYCLMLALIYFNYSLNPRKFAMSSLTQNFLFYFLLGAVLILVAPVLIPMPLLNSVHYSLLNFKMVFVRESMFSALNQLDLLSNIKGLVRANWLYMLVFAVVGVAALIRKKFSMYPLLLIGALIGAQVLLGVRNSIQDSLWIEIPLIALSLVLIIGSKPYWVKTLLAVILIFNVYKITDFKSFKITREIAYYDSHAYFDEVYGFGTYKPIMDQRYPTTDSKNQALQLAGRLSEIKSLLANNFSMSQLGLRDVTSHESKLLVNFKNISSNELNLHYRPDMTQIVYVPSHVAGSFVFERCEHGQVGSIQYLNESYTGFLLKGNNNKGIYTDNCIIKSEYLNKGFVLVENKAMATFKNNKL